MTGNDVRKIRAWLGMGQPVFSGLFGTCTRTISVIECGEEKPVRRVWVMAIEQYLDSHDLMKWHEIVDLVDEKNKSIMGDKKI